MQVVWIIRLMLFASTAAQGLSDFPLNYVIARQTDIKPVKLTCDTSDKDINWTLNGKPIEDGTYGRIHLNGTFVTVSDVESPVLGEYVCWSAGQKVSSTFLLQEKEKDDLDSLKCRAKSYDCFFTCLWNNSDYTAIRLRLGRECSKDVNSCQWVNSTRRLNGSFQFELFHSLSPYAEESAMLELTVEAINDFCIFRRTKKFYLRDIVQPDRPRIVRCQKEEQELNVTIEPPVSWSTPHSFFSLEHEIEYVLKDNGQIVRSSSTLIPIRISKFRVRCRDSYALSAWSQWTPWKNVT